jgi:hypothetical protein
MRFPQILRAWKPDQATSVLNRFLPARLKADNNAKRQRRQAEKGIELSAGFIILGSSRGLKVIL